MASCAVVLAVGARLSGQASFLDTAVQHHVGMARQRGTRLAGHRNHGRTLALEHWQDGGQLLRFAAVGDGHHQVVAVDHAQIAVAGLAGCTNIAGVPVDASVAAILRPMWPLLPMPMTTTRPVTASILHTWQKKSGPRRWQVPSIAADFDVEGLPRQRKACSRRAAELRRRWVIPGDFIGACASLASMSGMTALELTLVYLLAAVTGCGGLPLLKLPPMLGYLAVGVVIGPNALALARTPRACAIWASSVWCS
jgi:hypothetical protein